MRKNTIFLLLFTLFLTSCSSNEKKLIGKYLSDIPGFFGYQEVFEIKKRNSGLILNNDYRLEKVESNKWCYIVQTLIGNKESCISLIEGGKKIKIQYQNGDFITAKRI